MARRERQGGSGGREDGSGDQSGDRMSWHDGKGEWSAVDVCMHSQSKEKRKTHAIDIWIIDMTFDGWRCNALSKHLQGFCASFP